MGDGENKPYNTLFHAIGAAATAITLLLFIILIIVIVVTVIPELYAIDDNTEPISGVKAGTDYIPKVNVGIAGLHSDLTTMIAQLNIAAALLVSIDHNIANLCNGNTGQCKTATLPSA